MAGAFLPAEVVRPDHDWAGREPLEDFSVRERLLFFGRELVALLGKVEKLRPEEADPVGPVFQNVADFVQELDVRAHEDLGAVVRARDAVVAALFERLFVAGLLVAALSEERDDALGRLAPYDSVPAVDHDAVALPDFREELRHADHRRNAEGTREDCGVGRAAAALGHETPDAVAGDPH